MSCRSRAGSREHNVSQGTGKAREQNVSQGLKAGIELGTVPSSVMQHGSLAKGAIRELCSCLLSVCLALQYATAAG